MTFQIEDRAVLAVGQQTEPPCDLLIGLRLATQILAEAVLVELLVRFHVPQAAAVGADLVGQDDPAPVVVPDAPEFELEVDQADATPAKSPQRKSFTRIARSAMSCISSWLAQPNAAMCSSDTIGSFSASSL